jgi:hypothetical protein
MFISLMFFRRVGSKKEKTIHANPSLAMHNLRQSVYKHKSLRHRFTWCKHGTIVSFCNYYIFQFHCIIIIESCVWEANEIDRSIAVFGLSTTDAVNRFVLTE